MPLLASYLMPHAPVFIEEIGGHQTQQIKKTVQAMQKIAKEVKGMAPDSIVLISPHGPVFTDAITVYNQKSYHGNFGAFGASSLTYKLEKDTHLIEQIILTSDKKDGDYFPLEESLFEKFGHLPELDHGVLVPLHFILKELPSVKVVALSYGAFSYKRLIENGEILGEAIETSGENVVLIASGDMSHALKDSGPYAFDSNGPWFDAQMVENIENKVPWKIFNESESKIMSAKECGLRSFAIMMGTLKNRGISSRLISYEGPFGVGYLCAAFHLEDDRVNEWWSKYLDFKKNEQDHMREKAHPYVKFARAVIESRVKRKLPPKLKLEGFSVWVEDSQVSFSNLADMTSKKKATFVSIKDQNGLRGCIGTITPVHKNLLEEIYHNAMAAATKDYRFDPIEPDELDELKISVDVLSDLNPVEDYRSLNPHIEGVLVVSKGSTGVLLPDLDGIDDVEDQVRIACQKGGFTVDKIEEIYSFTVERFQ